MSVKIHLKLYSALVTNGYKVAKKDVSSFASLIVQLFGIQYLSWVIKQVKMEDKLKAAVIEQCQRSKEIQYCFQRNIRLQGEFLNIWLQPTPFFTFEKPQHLLEIEKKISYGILPFPAQETFFREAKDNEQIAYYEAMQLKGTRLLFGYFFENINKFTTEEIYFLQRTLFVHAPFYKKGELVSWPTLIMQWASEKKIERVRNLFLLFEKSLPLLESMPYEIGDESKLEDFQAHLIEQSIMVLEEEWGFSFLPHTKKTLRAVFKDEKKRLDCLFFSTKENIQYLPQKKGQPLFDPSVFAFQLLNKTIEFCKEPQEILECIFKTKFDFDSDYQNYLLAQLPKKDLSSYVKWTFENKIEENGFLLVCFFTKNHNLFEQIKKLKLNFQVMSPLQIMRYLSQHGSKRLSRTQEFTIWKELDDIAKLPKENLCYLYGIADENSFKKKLNFLRNLLKLLDNPLESSFVFSFLISEVDPDSLSDQFFKVLELLPTLSDKKDKHYFMTKILDDLEKLGSNEEDQIVLKSIQSLLETKFQA